MTQSLAILYGSSTGNTEMAAEMIRERLGSAVTHFADIADTEPEVLLAHDILILGVATWNIGDVQDDWDEFMPRLRALDLTGKKVALFAMGDATGYPYNFLDAMGLLWKAAQASGKPELVGVWPSEDYDFEESEALHDEEHFVGLGLDEDNEPELHEERISKWLAQILNECQLHSTGTAAAPLLSSSPRP
ncbi:MAG: flavodoxin [Nannocystaceae bacterium]|nr:flavodoxin [Nannocystaceae bacterium]